MSQTTICPHCQNEVSLEQEVRYTYNYHPWATPVFISLISIMLIGLDYFHNQEINWSHWAIVGTWLIFIIVQLLRSATHYGWLIIPFGGLLLSIFLYLIDISSGDNSRIMAMDWAGFAIIPILTLVVAFPIVARYARDEPNEVQRLELFVDQLEQEANQ